MQTLNVSDIFISLVVYICAITLVLVVTKYAPRSRHFWSIFNASSTRLVSIVLLAVTSGCMSLFYNDWIAYGILPLMFATAVVLPFITLARSTVQVSAWIPMIITLLFLMMLAPMLITLIKREDMSDEIAGCAGVLIVGFWIMGMILVKCIPAFKHQIEPFSHSRSLLLLLSISLYVFSFAGGKDYGIPAVVLMCSIAMPVWLLNGSNKVMSAEICTYQNRRYETAFLVTTLAFLVTLNLATSMAKKTNEKAKTMYIFSIVMFSMVLAVLASIGTIAILKQWNPISQQQNTRVLK